MCYRCGICNENVGPGKKISKHVIYRRVPRKTTLSDIVININNTREEVAREIPVCSVCGTLLDMGMTLGGVMRQRGVRRDVASVGVKPIIPVRVGSEMKPM